MRIKLFWSLAFIVILLNCTGAIAVSGKETLLVINPSEGNARSSEGDIIELKDGRLCLIYSRFTGSASDHGSADLAMRVSSDNGKTWSDDSIIVPNPGGMNVGSVSLLRLQSGEIALFYNRKTSHSDCRPLMRISTDEAKTWGEPVECITDPVDFYVLNNDRVVQLSSGRLVLPVGRYRNSDPTDSTSTDWWGEMMCYLSDDKGQTDKGE